LEGVDLTALCLIRKKDDTIGSQNYGWDFKLVQLSGS